MSVVCEPTTTTTPYSDDELEVERSSPRVLVIDDDPSIRHLIYKSLYMRGYQVILAENGHKAKSRFEEHKPSIVLLDLMMPIISGWDYLVWLKENNYIEETTVIVISAYATPSDEKKLLDQGVEKVIGKPFSLSSLYQTIETALR